MKENDVIKICEKCERTVVFWDEFAQKCWSVQNLLTENSNNVKDEDDKIIIKLEPFNENYSNDSIDGNDDNGSSIHECKHKIICNILTTHRKLFFISFLDDLKIENSLEVKLENLSQNEDTTKSKLGGKKKKKDKTENKPPSCIEYKLFECYF